MVDTNFQKAEDGHCYVKEVIDFYWFVYLLRLNQAIASKEKHDGVRLNDLTPIHGRCSACDSRRGGPPYPGQVFHVR